VQFGTRQSPFVSFGSVPVAVTQGSEVVGSWAA
jgi:hypothetical protein